jgi:hypothetical protein
VLGALGEWLGGLSEALGVSVQRLGALGEVLRASVWRIGAMGGVLGASVWRIRASSDVLRASVWRAAPQLAWLVSLLSFSTTAGGAPVSSPRSATRCRPCHRLMAPLRMSPMSVR